MSNMCVCPHCGLEMDPIRMPDESSWGGEIHYICFNDNCGYYRHSWDALDEQGIEKTGYRCRMDPRGGCGPAPVWSDAALKNLIVCDIVCDDAQPARSEDLFGPDAFSRDEESPDAEFYRSPRFVDHLDSVALETVEKLFARLIPENVRVLDLMAGPDSHLDRVKGEKAVVGLGLNEEELKANPALSRYVIHDVNADPTLPFDDNRFDAVVNTVSVDYMTKPLEVFREAARVLKPGGLLITVFSNRMFPPKAVDIWKRTNEKQRVELVKRLFTSSDAFIIEGDFESTGKPRPEDDKYYSLGIPSDPVYAVWGKPRK